MKIYWPIIVKQILVSLFLIQVFGKTYRVLCVHSILRLIFGASLSVVKMKFRQVRKRSLWGRKVNTVYKTWVGTSSELKKLRKPKLRLQSSDDCCSGWIGNRPQFCDANS